MGEIVATGLVLGGAALQGLGFCLALVDLNIGKKSVLGYQKRPQTIEVETAYESEVAFPVEMATGDQQPTVEERVGRLEHQLAEERTERTRAIRQVNHHLSERLEQVVSAVDRRTQREIKALAGLVALPPTKQEVWAIGLFISGLLLITVGTVIG